MNHFVRIVVAIVVFVAAYFFFFWIGGAFILGAFIHSPETLFAVDPYVSLAVAIVATVWVWRKLGAAPSGGTFAIVLKWAAIVGAVGFVAGFFGPMIFGGGNQGPLLGIFITGPGGFIMGALIGYGIAQREKFEAPEENIDE